MRATRRPPPWRRKLVVDPRFQWSVIWRVTAQSAFTLLLATLSLLIPLITHLTGHSADADCVYEASVLLYLHDNWWWVASTSLLCAGLAALRLSHRIAGPLVRFKRVLADLGRGRFDGPLRTRNKDYMVAEVAILNRTGAALSERFAALRASQEEISARLREALHELEFSPASGVRDAVLAAQAASTRLAAELTPTENATDSNPDATAPDFVAAGR